MPNEFIIKNGLTVSGGSTTITGSLIATGGITGSFSGSTTNATSASYALTASYALSSAGGGITVGTTTITSGTSGRIPYNNGGVYGESANLFLANSNTQLCVGAVNASTFQTYANHTFIARNSLGNNFVVGYSAANSRPYLAFYNDAATAANSWDIYYRTTFNFIDDYYYPQFRLSWPNGNYLNGYTYIGGTTSATAKLHIAAGTAAASNAPLKLTSGTNLTTPEAGAIEYNGTNLFFTPSSTRNILAQISGSTALTTGQIPFATTNGYLTSTSNLSWDSTNNYLTLTSNAATSGPTLRLYDSNASGRNFEISNANGANYATMYWKVGASAGAAPSSTLMTLTNTGYLALGLGNTNGSYPIDIGGAGVGGTLFRAKGSQSNHDIIIGNSSNNAFFGAYNSSFQILTQGNTSFPAVTITYSTTPNVGIALETSSPTARLHIAAGTATANTAPLKLTAGTNLTTPENGAFEFDGTNLYFTVGGVRKIVSLT